jgi:hypothetical protein
MLRKIGFIILIGLPLQTGTNKNDSFDKYYHNLKIIDLPISFTCLTMIDYPDYSNIPDEIDKKYRRFGYKNFGRLDLNKNVISVMQIIESESNLPIILNFKLDGTPVDTLVLLSCEPFPLNKISLSNIDSDKKIAMIDTIKYFKLDKYGNQLDICDSIIINQIDYKVDNNGYFNAIKNKTIKK